jgi:NAD+ synthase (glutamine-hydrolysing)
MLDNFKNKALFRRSFSMSFKPSPFGFLRMAVASPELQVGDVAFNTDKIRQAIDQAVEQDCFFIVFPELCVTAYTCADLFMQNLLLVQARNAIMEIADYTAEKQVTVIIGAPLQVESSLFNCAVFISRGEILGIVPKTYLPNTMEFYEERWFSSGGNILGEEAEIGGLEVPFGVDLLFQATDWPDCRIGIEICEDVWVPNPPSGHMAVAGATVLVNLSASPEILAKEEYRRMLVRSQSARCLGVYAYASAGPGESSTDLVFSGHSLIAENGTILAETERFEFGTQLALADIDVERMTAERRRNNNFGAYEPSHPYHIIEFFPRECAVASLLRPIPQTPFVPPGEEECSQRCKEIFALQTTGLAKRYLHTGLSHAVIGLSGGIDSTLALLVTVKAFDKIGLERKNITAVTMPGFGTTQRTRSNAEKLAKYLGVDFRTIPIGPATLQHFKDISQPEERHDITYENAQARERTQVLMDLANQVNGLVIGTGDLSELALGWCTYNADHMSMYSVNSGVPKTLVRYLVNWCAKAEFSDETSLVLTDIIATPVSPELLPIDENGVNPQETEQEIGPYLLHDFFLYHAIRLHHRPQKIFLLARHAFGTEFDAEEIAQWLRVFYRRFFSQQFKRSCLPDGPKVGSVALSPRGDWRMPSDASVALWLKDLEQLPSEQESN